ncbi:MAG: DUF2231 domain-containing protein [Gammaproteobacteria bacterium]
MILPNWHPIFVHFTVALLSVTAIFHVLAVFMRPSIWRDEFTILARWTLWLGAGITVITVIFGFWAYNTVEHDDPSHAAMKIHRNWAIATFAFYLLLAAWSVWRHHIGRPIRPFLVILVLIGSGLLGYTAWRGGEVVYRYGIGVMALPKLDQHRHEAGMQANPTMTMTPDPDATAIVPSHLESEHTHEGQ